jgi:sulfite reductase (NADPH) flavoprotein alpha-component
MSSMLALHSGSFFGAPGSITLLLSSLLMPLFTITGWMLYLDRRARRRALVVARAANESNSAAA